MSIYIPKKIKVGYQNRPDTYTKKLAYVIYYDEKNKLRKETSWNNWRDEKIEPDDFDNEPTRGFVLNKKVGDYSGDWGNHRQAYCRIYDPRGFEFEITINNLLYILENCDCLKGKGLDGEFVYGWDRKDLILIPVDSPDYKEIKTRTDKIQNGKRFKGKDLIIGATYLTKNEEKWIYMGRFDKWDTEINRYYTYWRGGGGYWLQSLDDTWTMRNDDKHGAYRQINKGKYYWFCTGENNGWCRYQNYIFESRKSIGDILIDCIDEKPNQKYSEMFSDLENNHFSYNPVDYNSITYANLSYEKLLEITNSENFYRMNAYDKDLNNFEAYKNRGTGLFGYNGKDYLLSELYNLLKPKYRIYKHLDGKEFHDYTKDVY